MSEQEFGARIRATDETGGAIRSAQSNIAGLVTAWSTGFLAIKQLTADVTRALSGLVAEADNLKRMAAQTDLSVSAVDRLSFVADRAESDIQSLARALDFMSRGAAESKDVFGELGLSVDALLSMDAEARFLAVVAALNGIENSAKRAQATFEVFGRTNLEIRGILALTNEELRSELDLADKMGTATAKQIEDLDKLGDQWVATERAIRSVKLALGELVADPIAKFLSSIADQLERIAKAGENWDRLRALREGWAMSPTMHIPRGAPPGSGVPSTVTVAASAAATSPATGVFSSTEEFNNALWQNMFGHMKDLNKSIEAVDTSVQAATDSLSTFESRTANVWERVFDDLKRVTLSFLNDVLGELLGASEGDTLFAKIVKGAIRIGTNIALGQFDPFGGGDSSGGGGDHRIDNIYRTIPVRTPQPGLAGDRVQMQITINAGFGSEAEGQAAARAIFGYARAAGVLA